ncbi:MAG: hypothetical protein MRY77_14275, partial [Rhodobacteraceae bacterium]|nr:hypothetical protein [Paracoccaceae bacterium]
TWVNDGTSASLTSQDVTPMIPPFGDFFNPGTGFAWAAWKTSGGAEGIEPPADIKKLWDLSEQFLQTSLGTPENDKLGAEIIDIHVDNLLKIGTVSNIVDPYLHRNDLQNVKPMTAKTYDYYWTYPYRPTQWWLEQ